MRFLRRSFTPYSISLRASLRRGALAVGFCLSAVLGCAVPSRADDMLTLQLPPSAAALEARAAARRAAAAAASVGHSRRTLPSRHGAGWRAQTPPERAVGRLGQISGRTAILRRRRADAAPLVMVADGTYVAIEAEQENWYGVLMADGSIGWIPARSIRLLDYEVVSDGQDRLPASGGSMPVGLEDIYPRSSNPYFTGDAQRLLTEAYRYLGVPYVWGGNTMQGIDCSGFVKRVFDACGYPLPRLGSDQMAYGVPVPADQLQPGDRIYFEKRTERVGVKHTGLYVGNGYFIHASSSRHGVAINSLTEPMWRRLFVCARR